MAQKFDMKNVILMLMAFRCLIERQRRKLEMAHHLFVPCFKNTHICMCVYFCNTIDDSGNNSMRRINKLFRFTYPKVEKYNKLYFCLCFSIVYAVLNLNRFNVHKRFIFILGSACSSRQRPTSELRKN